MIPFPRFAVAVLLLGAGPAALAVRPAWVFNQSGQTLHLVNPQAVPLRNLTLTVVREGEAVSAPLQPGCDIPIADHHTVQVEQTDGAAVGYGGFELRSQDGANLLGAGGTLSYLNMVPLSSPSPLYLVQPDPDAPAQAAWEMAGDIPVLTVSPR